LNASAIAFNVATDTDCRLTMPVDPQSALMFASCRTAQAA
jgi:hypothetical protein